MNNFENCQQQQQPFIFGLPPPPQQILQRPFIEDIMECRNKKGFKGFKETYNNVKNGNFNKKYDKIAIKRSKNVRERRKSFYRKSTNFKSTKTISLEELCKLIRNLNVNCDENYITIIKNNFKVIEKKGNSFEFLSNVSTKLSIILMLFFKSQKSISFREKCLYLMKCFFIGDPKSCVIYLKNYYKYLFIAVKQFFSNQNLENLINILTVIYISQTHDISFKNRILTIPLFNEICIFFKKSKLEYVEGNKYLFNLLCKYFITFLEHLVQIPPETSFIITDFILKGPMKDDIEINFTLLSVICIKYPHIYENFLHKIVFSNKIMKIKENLNDDYVLEFLENVSQSNIINKSLLLDYTVLFENFLVKLGHMYFIKNSDCVSKVVYFICKLSVIKSIALTLSGKYNLLLLKLLECYEFFTLEVRVNIIFILINVVEYVQKMYIFQFLNNKSIYIIYDQLKEAENYINGSLDRVESTYTFNTINHTKFQILSFLYGLFETPKKELICFFNQEKFTSKDLLNQILKHLHHKNNEIREISKKLVERIMKFLSLYVQIYPKYHNIIIPWIKCFGNNNGSFGNTNGSFINNGFGNNNGSSFGNNNGSGFGNNNSFGNLKDNMEID